MWSIQTRTRINFRYIDSGEACSIDGWCGCNLVPGGFGERGIEGKIAAFAMRVRIKSLVWVFV